jgi:hypothetical protein
MPDTDPAAAGLDLFLSEAKRVRLIASAEPLTPAQVHTVRIAAPRLFAAVEAVLELAQDKRLVLATDIREAITTELLRKRGSGGG